MTPELSEVERRMRPGAWSTHGFLLEGTSLADLMEEDARTLSALGATAEQLGQRLAGLLETASAGSDWFRPSRAGDYKVEIRRRRGFLTCPWAPDEFEPCTAGKGSPATANEFLVEHTRSGQRLEGFELSVHLIRDHAFFGGPGTRFRLEPERVVAILNP